MLLSPPYEVHLTNDQTHVLSLICSTNLHISLTAALLRTLRHEALLDHLCPPPPQGHSLSAIAMKVLCVSSLKVMNALSTRMGDHKQVMDQETLDLAWQYMKLDELLVKTDGLKFEGFESQWKKDWLEGTYAQTAE